MTTKHIVKRRGHKEPYDERKVYATVYAACRNAHLPQHEAEEHAADVAQDVTQWVMNVPEATSHQISRHIIDALRPLHKDAAFLFETHRDLA